VPRRPVTKFNLCMGSNPVAPLLCIRTVGDTYKFVTGTDICIRANGKFGFQSWRPAALHSHQLASSVAAESEQRGQELGGLEVELLVGHFLEMLRLLCASKEIHPILPLRPHKLLSKPL